MKCCILAAGKGSRLNEFSVFTHKALLPLGEKAVITRIIEDLGQDCKFVIAIGHQKELISGYLPLAHPDVPITLVEVKNFEGPGSGPGLSLFSCREELQEPFLFTACDTLITSRLPAFDHNWIGVKKVKDIERWCSVKLSAYKMVEEIYYKEKVPTEYAFTGIAFIKDVEVFWSGLEENGNLVGGELQVDNGLRALISSGIKAHEVEWVDTGTKDSYERAQAVFGKGLTFHGKSTDLTYRVGKRIVKFFPEEDRARTRFLRAKEYENVFSRVEGLAGNFYSYEYSHGPLLSERISHAECSRFLDWAEKNLWQKQNVSQAEMVDEQRQFYIEKTLGRLNKFCELYADGSEESELVVNDTLCAPARGLVGRIGDDFLNQGIASTFHGDLHGDNIICTLDSYVLIDWRESFGSSVTWGDRYYDLAKFMHTLELSVAVMDRGSYNVNRDENRLVINHHVDSRELEALEAFWEFVGEHGYDADRIRLIDALIFLNMAPLYSRELAQYLYCLGRLKLQRVIDKQEKQACLSYKHVVMRS